MNKELLLKYLNNSCNSQEFREVERWVKEDACKDEGKDLGFNDWITFAPDMQSKDKKTYSALLDKIHHQINLKEQKRNKRFSIGNITTLLTRAAAILFIPLLGVMFYMFSNNNFIPNQYANFSVDSLEIIAPIGSRSVIQLSDGTEVNLNYGSRIRYPRIFTGDTREVILEGEGYFDVAHNPERPFIVKTEKINVTALGTEFNVQAYSGDDVVATTLVEGKVVVDKVLSREKTIAIGKMIPGQHVEYNIKTNEVYSSVCKIDKYIAWKNGKLVFDNEPITNVAKKLSRMFNVEIEVANEVKDYTYTVTLVNDPLFLILDLMTEVTDVTYKVSPRKKLADGTFTKQKIRIEKK